MLLSIRFVAVLEAACCMSRTSMNALLAYPCVWNWPLYLWNELGEVLPNGPLCLRKFIFDPARVFADVVVFCMVAYLSASKAEGVAFFVKNYEF